MAYLQSSILNHILFLFFQTCLYVSYWVEISNLWVSKLSRTSDENRLSLLQKWKQGIIFFLYFLGFDILSLRPSALQSLTFKFWPSPQILSVLDKATHRNAVHWLYKAKLWAHECYVHCMYRDLTNWHHACSVKRKRIIWNSSTLQGRSRQGGGHLE